MGDREWWVVCPNRSAPFTTILHADRECARLARATKVRPAKDPELEHGNPCEWCHPDGDGPPVPTEQDHSHYQAGHTQEGP